MAVRDDSLPHQIRIIADRETHNQQQRVSCNCLLSIDHIGGKGNKPTYKPMPGHPKDFNESLAIYNDPANHNPSAEPF